MSRGLGDVYKRQDVNLATVLEMGCWTPLERFGNGAEWQARNLSQDDSAFDIYFQDRFQGRLHWSQYGLHSVYNALAALAAARHAGVPVAEAIRALADFQGIKRRMEPRGTVNGITVYDDFAHHPTAIATTIAGLRARLDGGRIIAVLEPRSNTMRLGVFQDKLAGSLAQADRVVLYQAPDLGWELGKVATSLAGRSQVCTSIQATIDAIRAQAGPGDQILIMSNGGFGGIHTKLLKALKAQG